MLHLGRALVELWEIKSARKVFAEVAQNKEFLATHREQAELGSRICRSNNPDSPPSSRH